MLVLKIVCIMMVLTNTVVSGFPGLDEIRGNGSLLVKTATHDGPGGNGWYDRRFPEMNFTCNGTIVQWTFIALQGVGGVSQLGLSRGPQLQENFTSDTESATLVPGSTTGYTLRVEDGLPFLAGDVFRLSQRPRLFLFFIPLIPRHLFLYYQGRRYCRVNGTLTVCEIAGNFGWPLVAVETGMHSSV